MLRYPKADWKGDGQTAGPFTGGPRRVVLHTTETTGIPGYDLGASAPHLTYNPRTRKWTQHTELDTSARAMKNLAGGVETNRRNAIQVEIVCYSSKAVADQKPLSRMWVGDLPPEALGDLAEFIKWAGVLPVWPEKIAYSSGQANAPGFRMESIVWDFFHGICGHQHVPENTHWDPGAFPWNALMALLVEDDMTPEQTKFVNDGVKAQQAQGPVYQAAMAAMKEAGIFTDSTDPDAPITSEKLAVFLVRFAEALDVSL